MRRTKNTSRSPRTSRRPVESTARYEITPDSGPVVAETSAGNSMQERRRISATEAARQFSDLINRVGYQGETYIIERGGRPMCELSPVDVHRFTGEDFIALLARLPRPNPEFLDAVEKLAREQPVIEASPWER